MARYIEKWEAKRIATELKALDIPIHYLQCMGEIMLVVRTVNAKDPVLNAIPEPPDMAGIRAIMARTEVTARIIFGH